MKPLRLLQLVTFL